MTESPQNSPRHRKPVRYVNVAAGGCEASPACRGMPPYLADALFELFAERRNGKEGKVLARRRHAARTSSDILRRIRQAQRRLVPG